MKWLNRRLLFLTRMNWMLPLCDVHTHVTHGTQWYNVLISVILYTRIPSRRLTCSEQPFAPFRSPTDCRKAVKQDSDHLASRAVRFCNQRLQWCMKTNVLLTLGGGVWKPWETKLWSLKAPLHLFCLKKGKARKFTEAPNQRTYNKPTRSKRDEDYLNAGTEAEDHQG